MEMKGRYKWMVGLGFCALLLLLSSVVKAQPSKAYTIKNGRMYIQLPKQIGREELATFVEQFDLADLGLETFLKTNKPDSLLQQGWKIESNNEVGVVISKKLQAVSGLGKIDDIIIFNEKLNMLFPAVKWYNAGRRIAGYRVNGNIFFAESQVVFRLPTLAFHCFERQ